MEKQQRVVMVGLGYIGLPTAALMASQNLMVLGVDTNTKVVETINRGEIHIVEPELDGLVKHVVDRKLLKASTEPAEADVYIIAVPTPFKENHQPDISYVTAATQSIISCLSEGNLVIIESTSPIGTTEKMQALILNARPELKNKLYFAYCPERVLPGNVIHELKHNDRVIGGIDHKSTEKASQFYSQFVVGQLHPTNARTAEMCKLVENSFRDVNIAFANELSLICDAANINVWELISLANKHPRVNILQPGPGVGGHCIAVDPWFIVADFEKQARIIREARIINNHKTEWVIERIESEIRKLSEKFKRQVVVACLGLSFKANIDDLRESPALEIAAKLKQNGHNIMAVEPHVDTHEQLTIVGYDEAIDKADLIVILVPHKYFKQKLFATNFGEKITLDFVGILAGQ